MNRHVTGLLCRIAPLLLLLLPICLPAQLAEPVDEEAVALLKKHGLEQGQVMDHLSWICDVHGPRLTGSSKLRQAQEWALGRFREWGLANVHLEEWGPFGRGWRLKRCSLHVVGDDPWPVIGYAKAWSPGFDGPKEADVVTLGGKTREEIEALDLEGRIVLTETIRELSEPFEAEARRHDAESLLELAQGSRRPPRGERPPARSREFLRGGALLQILAAKKPLCIIDRSFKGDYGTVFVSGAAVTAADDGPRGSRPRAWTADPQDIIPQFTISVEHYNRICRLLDKGIPVRMRVELETEFEDGDPMERNVLAEIPGTDPARKDEIVMLGAHFDSWHTATGCTDNGCGSAVMMEAMRLLTKLIEESGKTPRRTIRVALWSGEEQGLLGSRAYVRQHFAEPGARRGDPPRELKPAHAKVSGYFNLDNGTGRIRGVYLQGNEAVAPIFRSWLDPFHELEAATLTLNNTGGTDHLSFDAVGIPGFQFIQDSVAYSPRTHHSNMDYWDHAVAEDLKQAATIIASFVWHTAQRDGMLPRKPIPATRLEPVGR